MAGTRVRASIRDVDKGWARLKRSMLEVKRNNLVAKVGVLDDGQGVEVRDGGLTNAQIMAIHELGAPRAGIPERAPIRITYDAQIDELRGMMRVLLGRVVDGKMDARQALGIVGAKLAAEIKKTIVAGLQPPLSPATLARRINPNGAKPLIDTARLLGAITWAVVTRKRG